MDCFTNLFDYWDFWEVLLFHLGFSLRERASHYLCFCQLIYQSTFVASQKVFPKQSLSPHNNLWLFTEKSFLQRFLPQLLCGHAVYGCIIGCICSSILVQIRNFPVVTTYCALVCIAETFLNTEGKLEDKLQELQSHCQTVLSLWKQIRATPK